MDDARAVIRRWLHSAALRSSIAIEDAPAGFPEFLPSGGRATPLALLQHLVQIVRMLDSRLRGEEPAKETPAGTWAETRAELTERLIRIDGLLEVGGEAPQADVTRLAQGPMCDLVHHAGQLALLRRLAGDPPRPVRYLQEARAPVDRVAVARAYLEASNRHDLEAIAGLLHRDGRYVSTAVGEHRGRSAILAMMREFFAQVPDAHWEAGDPAPDGTGGVGFPFRLTGQTAEGALESPGRERLVVDLDGLLTEIRVER